MTSFVQPKTIRPASLFEAGFGPGRWRPSALAAGPFAGLQGGAVAGLMVAEIEAMAETRGWGPALSASAWFLKAAPMGPLRTEISVLREGGRISVVDANLYAEGEAQAVATTRVTLARERAVEAPGLNQEVFPTVDPSGLTPVERAAPHGGPWFMDAMEARTDGETSWFRLRLPVIPGAGPLAGVMGPADWAHGIGRPLQAVLADPNPNLTVHLIRPPQGEWIGVRAYARWRPERGVGMGGGRLFDEAGEIGAVSMAVALTPFPTPAAS